jgi:prevent-host-death family protein
MKRDRHSFDKMLARLMAIKFASIAEAKNRLSYFVSRARKRNESIILTHYGKPHAILRPISEREVENLGWDRLAQERLEEAWADDDDELYDYL